MLAKPSEPWRGLLGLGDGGHLVLIVLGRHVEEGGLDVPRRVRGCRFVRAQQTPKIKEREDRFARTGEQDAPAKAIQLALLHLLGSQRAYYCVTARWLAKLRQSSPAEQEVNLRRAHLVGL